MAMIQEPYVLAKLPEALQPEDGRLLHADVHSLAGHRKRKRSELALAIDRQCINVYDIQSSRLITSYAVSPLATFTCPPCSLRCQWTASSPGQRLTYCSLTSPVASLHCFRQSTGQDYNVAASSFEIRKPCKPIISLDTLAVVGDEEENTCVRVLAVHEDGEVRCYSGELERELWSSNAGPDNQDVNSSIRVEAAYIMPLNQAKKTLLKGREDLLVTLAGEDQHHAVTVLALFSRPLVGKDRPLTLRLLKLEGHKTDREVFKGSPHNSLQEIARTIISVTARTNAAPQSLSFHPTSGTLYQHSSDRLIISEILGMVPRMITDTTTGLGKLAICLRISPSLVLVNTTSSLSVVDTKYFSVQAQRSLGVERQIDNSSSSKKRRRHDAPTSNVRALSYFAPLDVVVALQGRQLVAFYLTSSGFKSRKRKSDVLLKDSIGHGTLAAKKAKEHHATSSGSKAFGKLFAQSALDDEWQKKELFLNKCFAENKLEDIEQTLNDELGTSKSSNKHEQGPASSPRKQTWTANSLDRRKTYYLLGKVFLLQDESSGLMAIEKGSWRTLKMLDLPPRILHLLIRHENFSVRQVETTLRHNGILAAHECLRSGAVIDAIAQKDPSLRMISFLLKSAAPLTAPEIICALRHSIAQSSQANNIKLLTYAGSPGLSIPDKAPESCVQGQDQEPPSNHASFHEKAQRSETAQRVFVTAISRLYKHSPHSVSKALRDTFSRTELQSLVDILRMELARNGWLASHFDDQFYPPTVGGPESTEIAIIAHLLNCVLDSIGSGGWISRTPFPDDLTEAAETLAYMKVEISAALEGIMEATYLKSMLGEMLLCGKNLGSGQSKAQGRLVSNVPMSQKAASIVQIGGKEDAILPLGLKAAQKIGKYRVGAGGELIKRSKRDIQKLQSKMVPKYSFEKIMI